MIIMYLLTDLDEDEIRAFGAIEDGKTISDYDQSFKEGDRFFGHPFDYWRQRILKSKDSRIQVTDKELIGR